MEERDCREKDRLENTSWEAIATIQTGVQGGYDRDHDVDKERS